MNHEIINQRKKHLGITNAQLAEMTGITLSTLDKITSGKNKNPTLDTLQAIADAIGCEIDDFRDKPGNRPSVEALQIAYAYDRLNDHSKLLVRTVVDLESRRPVEGKMVPVIQGSHDNTVYAQYYAKEEQQEMAKSEISE